MNTIESFMKDYERQRYCYKEQQEEIEMTKKLINQGKNRIKNGEEVKKNVVKQKQKLESLIQDKR